MKQVLVPFSLFMWHLLLVYHIVQNFGGGKFWHIWRMNLNQPKISPPNLYTHGLQKMLQLKYFKWDEGKN